MNSEIITTKKIELFLNSSSTAEERYFVTPIKNGMGCKNYLVGIRSQNNFKYILKIYSKKDIEDLKFEIELLNHLKQNAQNIFFPIVEKTFSYHERPCILLKYVPGRTMTKNDISSKIIKSIAEKQAKMHKIFATFVSEKTKKRFSIVDFGFTDQFMIGRNDKNYKIINNEIKLLEKEAVILNKISFSKSIIHEDLSMENIIINKGKIIFIDFGESHYAEIISDIAIAIKELIITQKGMRTDLIKDYLNTYQCVTSLSDSELNAISFLLRRRTVFMLAYYTFQQKINNHCNVNEKIILEITILKMLKNNINVIKNIIKQ